MIFPPIELAKNGFIVFNVDESKCPITGKGYKYKDWIDIPGKDIVLQVNYEINAFGMRLGEQINTRKICSLDFDCCHKPKNSTEYLPEQQCIELLNKYNIAVDNCKDGMYSSSTAGNYNVLVDYTDVPELVNLLTKQKAKVVKKDCGLELLLAGNQVIPPTATKCKITQVLGKPRQFMGDIPFMILEVGSPVIKFITDYIEDAIVKPVTIPLVVGGGNTIPLQFRLQSEISGVVGDRVPTNNATVDSKVIERYTDMLMTGLNFHMEYNDYLKISGVMKTNGFSNESFCNWVATTSPRDNTHLDLWNAPCKIGKISIFTLDNICKSVNLDFYKTWLTKWKINPTFELYKQFDAIFTVDILYVTAFTSGSLAEAFKLAYGDIFRYCNKTVFHFNGVYWKPDNSNKSKLCCFIDTDFYKLIMGYLKNKTNKLKKQLDAENNSAENIGLINEKIDKLKKLCLDVVSLLRYATPRASVATDICNRINNEEQEWNLNPNMFCFENCVIDITTGKPIKADPKHFINMSCGYDYNDKYSLDLVTQLETLITSIQPDKALKDYLLQVLSTSLLSEQIQAFFILTGRGGNGKSVLMELMVEMLGQYAYNLPAGFISKTIKEGGNPEASGMDCKRLVIVSEPESKDPICCATVKKITGDTKINVRPLYSNQTGIDLKCTVVMICNEKPVLDEVNDAVSRRMRAGVIPFGQKFVSKNELDSTTAEEIEQFNMKLGDVKYVSQQFKTEYKQALFMILLPYLQIYKKNLFSDAPPIVIQESKAYIKGCDNIYEWFEENYEADANSVVFVDDMFNNYSSTNEFYQLSKEDKRKYGTAKKFKEILQGNLFIRKYYKEREQYWNKIKYKKPFIAGWKIKLPESLITIDDDTTTVVD